MSIKENRTKFLNLIQSQDIDNIELSIMLMESVNLYNRMWEEYSILCHWMMNVESSHHFKLHNHCKCKENKDKDILLNIINYCHSITYLKCSYGGTLSKICKYIHYLPNLKSLIIGNGSIKYVPKTIKLCNKLEVLDLRYNPLTTYTKNWIKSDYGGKKLEFRYSIK